jgi:hypothetical protein
MYINIDNYGLRVYVNMHNENGSFEIPKYIPIDALTMMLFLALFRFNNDMLRRTEIIELKICKIIFGV